VTGDAGLGKSALLRAVESTARDSGIRVFHGGSEVSAQSLPLAPLLDALISSPEAGIDLAALRELGATEDQRYWLLRELEEQLERAAMEDPVLIALDDVQWADAATLSAISILPRRMASHRILWAFAARGEELRQNAQLAISRLRAGGAVELRLARLDDTAVAEVSKDILLGEPDERLRTVLDRVGGQPLWLVELLRGLRDEQLVSVEDGIARLIGEGIPRRLLESVTDQLARLAASTRECLQIACVLGRSFSLDELASLMDRSPSTLIESVREALGAGLIVDLDDRLAFRHDLIREAIEAGLPPAVRRSLRRRALDVLLKHGAPAADVAGLVMEVARPGDDHAISLLEQATTEIGRVSPSVAAPLSRRLLELLPDDTPAWSARAAETVSFLVHSGQASEARKLITEAAPRMVDHTQEAGARMTLGSLELQYGPAGCEEQCRLGLRLPGLPLPLRIALLSLRGCSLEMLGETQAAADSAAQATNEGLSADHGFEPVANLPARALVAFDLGDWRTAVDLAGQGVVKAELAEVPAPRAWMFDAWKALIHIALGQLHEALELIDAGVRDAEQAGIAANLRVWSMLRARTMLGLARFADAAADAEAVMEMSDEIGEGGRGYINHIASYVLSCIALHTGDTRGLAAARRSAVAMSQVVQGRARPLAAWMNVRLNGLNGDFSVVARVPVADIDPTVNGVPHVSSPRRFSDQPELVRLLLAAGRRDDAIAVSDRLSAAVDSQPDFPFLQGTALHARALIASDHTLADEAVDLFKGCVEPLITAEVLEDAGRLRPAEHTTEAVELLDAALEIYDAAGAHRHSARVRGLLRQRGARRTSSTSRSSSRWPELSDSEVAVVRLVATGATNRQVGEQLFLSPHTVNAHLRHIFAKLDIRSRVELARITAERDNDRSSREL
jgi:DNA-binding CsgD family transcriptional regulator